MPRKLLKYLKQGSYSKYYMPSCGTKLHVPNLLPRIFSLHSKMAGITKNLTSCGNKREFQKNRNMDKRFYIRSHPFGTMSSSSLVLYHLFGAMMIVPAFSASHAAHQLNELLAIMKWLQADISRKSSGAWAGPLMSTYVWGLLVIIFRLHHSGSSEKIKKWGSVVRSQIECIALL